MSSSVNPDRNEHFPEQVIPRVAKALRENPSFLDNTARLTWLGLRLDEIDHFKHHLESALWAAPGDSLSDELVQAMAWLRRELPNMPTIREIDRLQGHVDHFYNTYPELSSEAGDACPS